MYSDIKNTRCPAMLGWSRLAKQRTSLFLQREEIYLWRVKPESCGGAGRSHELVGGTRQIRVPKFLPLPELGSHIGRLQTLCILLCHQSRAPALQNTTSKPPCSLCRMSIFWHWYPGGLTDGRLDFMSSKKRLQATPLLFQPSYRLWVC